MESTKCMISNGLRNSSPNIHSCRSIQIVRYSYKKNYFKLTRTYSPKYGSKWRSLRNVVHRSFAVKPLHATVQASQQQRGKSLRSPMQNALLHSVPSPGPQAKQAAGVQEASCCRSVRCWTHLSVRPRLFLPAGPSPLGLELGKLTCGLRLPSPPLRLLAKSTPSGSRLQLLQLQVSTHATHAWLIPLLRDSDSIFRPMIRSSKSL